MSRACEGCGTTEAGVDLRVWRWTCRSCDGTHNACDPCVSRLGLKSDEETTVGVSHFLATCPDAALLAEELMGGMDPGVLAAHRLVDGLKYGGVSDETARRVVSQLARLGVEVKTWSVSHGGMRLVLADGTKIEAAP